MVECHGFLSPIEEISWNSSINVLEPSLVAPCHTSSVTNLLLVHMPQVPGGEGGSLATLEGIQAAVVSYESLLLIADTR